MNEQLQNIEEIIYGLIRPERMANIISQFPKYLRDEIAGLVEGEKIPGSFGDLIKRSIAMIEEHQEFDGENVVSIFRHRPRG